MTDLAVTHETTVTEDQIDHLGHMNVRFYGVAARTGTDAIVADLGMHGLEVTDLYTRHFREQMLGAHLEVRSGVLGGGEGWLRLYHELRDTGTGDLAASFVHRLEARDLAGIRTPAAWSGREGPAATIDIPEHGRPRSIDLDVDPAAVTPTLDEARDHGLAMRRPRTIGADECQPDGTYRLSELPMLVWGGEPVNGATGPTLHDGPDGQKIGWAAMENRTVLRRLPRAGDRIQSFGAVLELFDKATHRILWAFDVDRGDVLLAFEVVDLAFDTVARRAVRIPDDLRAQAETILRPEFAPV